VISPEEPSTQSSGKHDRFLTTHWSQVLLAARSDSSHAHAALTRLCKTYWYPLYIFARRQGKSPEDAQDLVQGFFAQLLLKEFLKDADPQKGRFRSFLLVAVRRYMANEWDRANRLKRGGGQEIISLDEEETERRYQAEPVDEMSPEKAYERQWAITLLKQVLGRLEAEFQAGGKLHLFDEIKRHLGGDEGQNSYAEIGVRLGMSEGAVKVAVHRLRHRYRELLRLEIAHTVTEESAIDEEIRHLFAAMG
jgi:RNA polymerase sigma-70 factor (ECF subfamily)